MPELNEPPRTLADAGIGMRTENVGAETWTGIYYLLVCRECDPDETQPIPFESPEARGKWSVAHTAGTGHDTWRVIDHRWMGRTGG